MAVTSPGFTTATYVVKSERVVPSAKCHVVESPVAPRESLPPEADAGTAKAGSDAATTRITPTAATERRRLPAVISYTLHPIRLSLYSCITAA